MPTCDQSIIDASATLAQQINPGKNYYEIHVKIIGSTFTDITIEADNAVDALGSHTFNVPWGDPKSVWPACPSTVPTRPGYPPDPGATGVLYISIDYLESKGIIAMPTKWPKIQ
jgi:hypothetical protein